MLSRPAAEPEVSGDGADDVDIGQEETADRIGRGWGCPLDVVGFAD